MASEKILVVDDNAANVKLVSFLLVRRGYVVESATSGPEALSLLATFKPRLILMDLQMPGMDGCELTRRLKGDPATNDIAIVALTAYAMKGDEQRALSAGCDSYMTKPIDTDALVGIVEFMLARPPT